MITQEPNGQGGLAIVTSDATSQGTFRGLYIGGAGDVSLVGLDGATCVFKALPVGSTLWVGCTRINTTNTTATFIVGLT